MNKEVRLQHVDLTFHQTASLSFIMSLPPSLSYSLIIIYSYLHRLVSVVDISSKAKANLPEPFDPA